MSRTIIISDLDGTLLDAATYSFEAARPALERIREKKIPLILCSSKSRMEIEVYRKRLGNIDPFVSENGGGVFVPEKYFPFSISTGKKEGYEVLSLGRPYSEVRRCFLSLLDKTGIKAKGFGDMSAYEIALLTSLPLEEAALAKMRDFDEPFIFEAGTDSVTLLKAIENAGFRWTQGQHFHMLGEHDKGRAVRVLKQYYEKVWGGIETIGVGDSLNDLPFLQEVNTPILVQKKDGTYDPRVDVPHLIRVPGIGPEGWNRAILELTASS